MVKVIKQIMAPAIPMDAVTCDDKGGLHKYNIDYLALCDGPDGYSFVLPCSIMPNGEHFEWEVGEDSLLGFEFNGIRQSWQKEIQDELGR
jgi:hypothetical protein